MPAITELRSPAYLLTYVWHALRGVLVLSGRLLRWWHAPHLYDLVSLGVASGRSGHHDAMNAHKEGRRTRTRRGQILAVSAVVAVAVVLAAVAFLPWQAWPPVAVAALLVLARHGKPEGKPVVQAGGRGAAVPAADAGDHHPALGRAEHRRHQ